MGIIYLITCTITSKQYVGLTKNSLQQRWREHKSTANSTKRNTRLCNAIRKYGPSAFTASVLEEVQDDSMLPAREIHWIAALGTFDGGYNLTSGGEQRKELSAESRLKCSLANLGSKRSAEFRRRRSEFASAQRHSPETLAKMSAWQKGKKKSEAHAEKIRERQARSVFINEVFYRSIKTASDALGIKYKTLVGRFSQRMPGYQYADEIENGG